ncbi:hypothetical protein SLEP1_g37421 [Rubroshorea leprosula]|uniref:Uncharacterized protein n=1 Tax=Rubroshorea leprosula TaxID=152421 RepID=A0AAV5KUQ5_9ROSI|nr:hypothetical protein SLEP1_g37421 [Rubroshorea leprosula]
MVLPFAAAFTTLNCANFSYNALTHLGENAALYLICSTYCPPFFGIARLRGVNWKDVLC